MNKILLLVDASGYVFRTHYALAHAGLTSPDGQSSHIIMGVLNMIERLQKQYPDGSIVMVFDGKGNGVRADWDANYKANRSPTPSEIKTQVPPLQEIIRARGIPLLVKDNLEADDIIATLATQAKPSYEQIIVASGDKDLAQLVDEKVVMLYDDKKNILFDIAGVKEKWQVTPDLIPDYLSLIGDKVDNIPGVEKVGPKTAVAWLTEYGSLQDIIDNADKIGGKVGDNLREALPKLPLSLKMNTLISDATLPLELKQVQQQLAKPEPDRDKLLVLYRKYGLSRFLSSISDDSAGASDASASKVITSGTDWQKLLTQLKKSKSFSIYAVPVTEGEDPMISQIVGLALALRPKEGFYVPCGHDYDGAPAQLELQQILNDLAPLLADDKIQVITHDVKLLGHLLANQQRGDLLGSASLPQIANYEDTMLLSYISNSAQKHDLGSLTETYLKLNKQDLESLVGKGKGKHGFNVIELDKASSYAVAMASSCLGLYQLLSKELKTTQELLQVYQQLDLPLTQVLLAIEQRGTLLDTKLLAKQSAELEKSMAKVEAEAYTMAGEKFNINSPAQLKTILYDKMGFSTEKKTGGGQLSTAESVLNEMVARGERFPELILEYRGLSKLKGTYTDALPLLVNAKSGRVHTSFNQAVASTGRLSSANPNLQNIPIRTKAGRNVRAAFIAPKGMIIASADYSQIELRIMAHLSGDKSLLNAFAQGQDVHAATAAELFDLPLDKVDYEQRRRAKIVNFGLIYGMGPFGLAKQLGISNSEGQDFVKMYFERYPGVRRYMDDTREAATKLGWAATLSGRRVYLPQINSDNFVAKQAAVRAAINAPVQGSAADLIKLAMINLLPQLKQGEAHMVLQVHDELVFEIREGVVDKYKKIICRTMESVAPLNTKLKVPLVADFGIGKDWKEAH